MNKRLTPTERTELTTLARILAPCKTEMAEDERFSEMVFQGHALAGRWAERLEMEPFYSKALRRLLRDYRKEA